MKAPTKQLTPEVRKKIAKALVPDGQSYDAEYWSEDWKALTTALAGRIDSSPFEHIEDWIALSERFIHALATNNTSALESLFAELIGETDA